VKKKKKKTKEGKRNPLNPFGCRRTRRKVSLGDDMASVEACSDAALGS
jgi:hypothetical protein